MSETLQKPTLTLKTKLDVEKEKGKLQKKLKSYNLGKEFNYAVAVLKFNIGNNCESDEMNSLTISLIPKIQYITPFVSKELAEKYMNELEKLGKLFIFLDIGEDGRVVMDKDINDLSVVHFTLISKFNNCGKCELFEDVLDNKQIEEYQQWVNTRDDIYIKVNPVLVDRGLCIDYSKIKNFKS